jgi:hypothetical protein
MRLGLLVSVLAAALMAIGCGGSSNYRLPVDSVVAPYEKPEAGEFEAEVEDTDEPEEPIDDELLDEEVPDDPKAPEEA